MIPPSFFDNPKTAGNTRPLSGGFVFVRILEKKPSGAWLVEVRGKRLEIFSERELVVGGRMTGKLVAKEKGVFFLPREKPPASGKTQARDETPQPALFSGREKAAVVVLNAFLRAGLQPPPKSRLGEIAGLADKGMGPVSKRRAALLARCEEKGLDLTRETFDELFDLFEGNSRQDGGGERRRREKKPPADTFAEIAAAADEGDTPLKLFNHTKGSEGSWVTIPYGFAADDLEYTGSLRLWYNSITKCWEKAVLSVLASSGKGLWFFRWNPKDTSVPLEAYFGGDNPEKSPEWEEFKRKLRKIGLKCDDTIHKVEDFDGFEAGKDLDGFVDTAV